jgi:hypothetical protein
MADFPTDTFEKLRPEEQAKIKAAEASADALLNGVAEVKPRLRFGGSLDHRLWIPRPADDARATAAGVLFVAYVDSLWLETNPAKEEAILAFLESVDQLIPPILSKFGVGEDNAMISELHAECERSAWRVSRDLRGEADSNARYARLREGFALEQEKLLKDARAWAGDELIGVSVDFGDTDELRRRVVKRAWDEFVPRHRYYPLFRLGYEEFGAALWKEGWPSLEEVATSVIRDRAASGSQTAVAPDPRRRQAAKSVRRNKTYETIDSELREIAKSVPKSHEEVFSALEGRAKPPDAEPFKSAGGWLKGFKKDAPAARSWLSRNWARLGLPPFPRGPKK